MDTIGNSILGGYGDTIFAVMSALAAEHGAINLGQGAPDEDGPADILEAAARALLEGPNQYPSMWGIPELRRAVAEHDGRFYGLDVDWEREVMITHGATEALAAAFIGLLEPGDEAVLIEPLYDSYLPLIRRGGGVPRLVRMEPPDWELPRDALAEAFNDRTKLLVLNTPHNPSGKVFSEDELAFLAELLKKHDAYAICDEVYEHLVFDGRAHKPLIAMPGMRERCVRIGSAGKTFSMTGWKVGYAIAAPRLLQPVAKAHQFLTFTIAPNLQAGVAYGLGKDDGFFAALASDLRVKRDLLARGLETVGFKTLPTRGSYFLTADISSLGYNGGDDAFCRYITTEVGVCAIPISAFYREADVGNFVRFCFCKREDAIEEAIQRLAKLSA